MKKTLLLTLALMLAVAGYSQYYYLPFLNAGQNPGNLNPDPEYPVGGGIAAGWAQVLAGSQATPAWSASETVPFPFLFNGDTVTNYFVSSSGVLTFSGTIGTAPSYTNLAIPDVSIPDNSICIWGLAGLGSNDIIVTKTFGTAPNRQHWVSFTSYNYGGGGANDWVYWSIVLEETTNNIYIVDQRTNVAAVSLTLGIQIDGLTAISVAGSPNVSSLAGTDATAADNTYYQFIPGQQPDYDIATISSPMATFLNLSNAPFSIQAKVFNYGVQAVQSIAFNYAINNGTPVTANLTSLNIATLTDALLTSSANWTPTQSGPYDIKIWMSNINGNPDENNSNDTLMISVVVLDTIITKKVLVEQATGAWCGYCPDGTVVMKDILQSYPNAIGITLHNGDAMAFTDGNTVNSTYVSGYPAGMVDRVKFPDQTAVGFSRNAWKAKTAERLATPVPIHVEASHTYDMATRQVNVTVKATFYENMSGDFRFNCYIIEDSLTGTGSQWAQANYYNATAGHPMYGLGNPIVGYVHNLVTRQMLGGPWGTAGVVPATVTKGSTFEKTYTYTLPAAYRPQHISLVALLQHYSTNVNDREILNADKYKLHYYIGLDEQEIVEYVNLYPNPAGNTLNVAFELTQPSGVKLEVVNMMGQVILTENYGMTMQGPSSITVSTADLSDGYYFVRLITDSKVGVYPFIRKR
jgi:hypothetical protein